MPDNVSIERTLVMRAFGAEVIHTEGAKYTDGAIELANRMADDDDRYFLTSQFDNADNPLAHYETTGPEILRDLPEVDAFIAGTGHRRHAGRRGALPEGAAAEREESSASSRSPES